MRFPADGIVLGSNCISYAGMHGRVVWMWRVPCTLCAPVPVAHKAEPPPILTKFRTCIAAVPPSTPPGVTRPNRPGINVDMEPPAVKLKSALGGILTWKLAGESGLEAGKEGIGRKGPLGKSSTPRGHKERQLQ